MKRFSTFLALPSATLRAMAARQLMVDEDAAVAEDDEELEGLDLGGGGDGGGGGDTVGGGDKGAGKSVRMAVEDGKGGARRGVRSGVTGRGWCTRLAALAARAASSLVSSSRGCGWRWGSETPSFPLLPPPIPPDDDKSTKSKAKEGAVAKKGATKQSTKQLTLAQKLNKALFGWLDSQVKVRLGRGKVLGWKSAWLLPPRMPLTCLLGVAGAGLARGLRRPPGATHAPAPPPGQRQEAAAQQHRDRALHGAAAAVGGLGGHRVWRVLQGARKPAGGAC